MSRVVLVHGIGQQHSTREEQERQWLPSLVKGVLCSSHQGAPAVAARLASSLEVGSAPVGRMAFYGDLFLLSDVQGEDVEGNAEAQSIAEELARAVLRTAAVRGGERTGAEARQELQQISPELSEVQRAGAAARSAIAVLDGNRWLATRIFGLARRVRPDLMQVARYLADPALREQVQGLVADLIDDETRLIIGHSLGSVVAWEACHRLAQPLPMLITLGSPLGLGGVVYDRLRPYPPTWPPKVDRWVNVAHRDDFIAVEPRLAPLFQSADRRLIEDHELTSKHEHHGIPGYLEEPDTGWAVAEALDLSS
jgi:hypothetical protein